MLYINKGTRFTNFATDYLVIIVIWVFLAEGSNGILGEFFVLYAIVFLYYFLFELTKGQTLGKMITKTKVVGKDGKAPSVFKIFARSMLRLVPIDIISYLFGTELGFHDILSGTKLKKKCSSF